jgi:hypothetical protein
MSESLKKLVKLSLVQLASGILFLSLKALSYRPLNCPIPSRHVPHSPANISLGIGAEKSANLFRAHEKVLEVAAAGAQIIVLPECFDSPYGCEYFPLYGIPCFRPIHSQRLT